MRSETGPVEVKITGGTYTIGLLVYFLLIESCVISDRLQKILDRMPKPAEATETTR